MKKNARRNRKMRKVLMMVCCMALLVGITIGGTVAWLTASTGEVKNTFTPSTINITLEEELPANKTAKMLPGSTIGKDPKVGVVANSEAHWLFVEIVESNNFDAFMTYEVADGWTAVPGVANVYYREIDLATAQAGTTTPYPVLANNTVTVRDTVTKAMMDALTAETYPTLTFKAYAVQKEAAADAATAWTLRPTTGN